MKKKLTFGRVLIVAALVAYTVFLFFPLITVLITSFIPSEELASSTTFLWWSENMSLEAYKTIFLYDSYIDIVGVPGLLLGLFNTLWLTLIPLVVGLVVSGFSAYAFSKMDFPFKETLFKFSVIIRSIPLGAFGVISYVFYSAIGWTGENGFLPLPDDSLRADVIYICSPGNPTGAVFDRLQLQAWVDFANETGAVILFDAAYEIFIEDKNLPHSIYELDGADRCAIEFCSLSKTAGFTGTRLGYTVVPHNLIRNGMSLNTMWSRNRETRTNGISYILQKGAAAVFTPEGQKQIHENLQVYKNNAKVFMEALDTAGVWYCGGKNSPYIWMKCPDGMSGWDFFDYLLNEIQVVGIPGDGFGDCGKGYFRFSTFGDPEETSEAAQRLCALLCKK